MDNLELVLNKISQRFTPEYLEQLSKDSYNEDRQYPENFSNWYNHIVDFGKLKHVNIISNQILTYEETEIFRKTENINEVNFKELETILKPTLDKMEPCKLYSIKNGCFSNKFDFTTSIASKTDLAKQLWKINYNSSLFETGGYTELVVRDLIPNTFPTTHPTIYKGMPLRQEFRVFYNIDKKQIEYIVDYWNYEYCIDALKNNTTDTIIFNYFHNKIQGSETDYMVKYNNSCKDIVNLFKDIKFDNCIEGIWSIDILKEGGDYYLIDMARGFRSAYWDINKLQKETKEELLKNK